MKLYRTRAVMRSVATLSLVFVGALLSATAQAGSIVSDGYVSIIENTSGNQALFTIKVTGGTGPCVGQTISFPVWAAPDADTHKRAYAAAMLAFSLGYRVSVWNYVDNTCTSAAYIAVIKD